MLNKKQRIRGKIEKVLPNGLGTFYAGKDTVLVKYVLADEEVEVIISKKLKEGYLADLVRVIKPSSIRCKVRCNYFMKCGSCDYLHMLYPFELKRKTDQVKALVYNTRLNLKVSNCEGMKDPFAYRNKMILSFARNNHQQMVGGFYEAMSHRVVNVDKCLLHDDEMNQLIVGLKQVIKKSRIEIYDEGKRTGFLRHILIRKGFKTNELMIVFVTADKEFKGKKNFINELLKINSNITSVIQNVNSRQTSVVLGEEEYLLYGKPFIRDYLCDLEFMISSKSFYQVNPEQCEKLYTKALSLLDLKGDELLVDTYCGIGTISLIAAQKVKHVYGVEINKDAIKNANENKRINNINNVDFVCEDAGEYMQYLAHQKQTIDVVIMDPARDGSDEKFLNALQKLKPKKVVYISCNPETQIRDMKYLSKTYTSDNMYLYDMFPKTNNVESVVLLTLKK